MRAALLAIVGLIATTGISRLHQSESLMVVRGLVIDEVTQRPLASVRIQIVNSDRRVMTDSAGHYAIDSLRVSNASVQADAIGYIREIRDVETPFPPHVVCPVGGCKPWRPVVVLNFYLRRKPEALF
jgi:hypothetical protein